MNVNIIICFALSQNTWLMVVFSLPRIHLLTFAQYISK